MFSKSPFSAGGPGMHSVRRQARLLRQSGDEASSAPSGMSEAVSSSVEA